MYYNKLVRDKIPEILKKKGLRAEIHIASHKSYVQKLNEKLTEETNEFLKSKDVEELADLLEVVYAIVATRHLSKQALEAMRKKKSLKKGAFKNRIILEKISKA